MIKNYPQIYINEFYELADQDWSSFISLVGAVESIYLGEESDNHLNLGKSNEQLLQDTFILIKYLISTGDFEIGKLAPSKKGEISDVFYYGDNALIPYSNFSSFQTEVLSLYQIYGFDAEPLHSKIWLNKKSIGKKAPKIPEEIKKLFAPNMR